MLAGAAGRMGQSVCAAVEGAADMELVVRADPQLDTHARASLLEERKPEVVVDFTRPDTALQNALRVRARRSACW